MDVRLVVEDTTEIHHADVEEGIAVAEIAQVDEIACVAGEDGVRELQVAMDGRVSVGHLADESPNLVFLNGREERVLGQEAVVAFFHILEL